MVVVRVKNYKTFGAGETTKHL